MPSLTPDEGLVMTCAFGAAVLGAMLIVGPLPGHVDYAGAVLCVGAVLTVVAVGRSALRRHRSDDL